MQQQVWERSKEQWEEWAPCACMTGRATFCAVAREIVDQMAQAKEVGYFNVLLAQLRAHRHGDVVITDDEEPS